jgi:serine/threonine-protein kinase
MASPDRTRPADEVPPDLLPLLQKSGILTDKQYESLRKKVLEGSYPLDTRDLASRLVRDRILTEYQARRLVANRPSGMVVGRYVIMDRIGAGAMGRVYKAHHQLMDRVVALKIIAPELVSNARLTARFQREMKMVGRLDHPNVVRAYDADAIGPTLYIVMEYVPGLSLGQKFKNSGPMPPLEVVDIAAQAALGLAHAHAQGIVHRDVKPSNILLGDGVVKVLDLGLGVLMEADEQSNFATADGIAVGTIDYMSPEQAAGKEVDGRSDLFGLGCSMYHVIAGRPAFPGDSPVERLGKRITGRHIPITDIVPDLPPGLVEVIDRMLEPKPQDRFPTADAAAEALHALLGRGRPARPRPADRPAAPAPPTNRRTPTTANVQQPLVAPPPAPPEPRIVKVEPRYPGWFRPLARLAERSPSLTLAVALAAALTFFAAGALTMRLMR